MCTESNKSKVAIVGWGENLNWFDTMPGEQMAVCLHSRDVGGPSRSSKHAFRRS